MQEKQKRWINILSWVLLGVAIVFVIITSCIIKYKKDRMKDLSSKNEQIEGKLQDEDETAENLLNFLKNF